MFFTTKKEIIGIDIGSSSVKAVQLREAKGVWHLQNLGVVPLPAEAIVDNTLMDSSSVVEATKNLLKSLNSKAKDVSSSVSGNSIIIRKNPFADDDPGGA